MDTQKKIIAEILKQLKESVPTEQDKSVMIKLTPLEILNIAKMGAMYWSNAQMNNTTLTMEEVCKHHVEIAIEILRQTDPERFEQRN